MLTLNPDLLMEEDFLSQLMSGEMDPSTGVVCGKLLTIGPGFRRSEPSTPPASLLCGAPSLRPRLASIGRWRYDRPNMSSEPARRRPSTAGG